MEKICITVLFAIVGVLYISNNVFAADNPGGQQLSCPTVDDQCKGGFTTQFCDGFKQGCAAGQQGQGQLSNSTQGGIGQFPNATQSGMGQLPNGTQGFAG